MPYPIFELPDDAPIQLEQLGTKTKFWYEGPTGQKMLFKVGCLPNKLDTHLVVDSA